MIFRSKTQKIDTHSQLKINGIVIDFVSSTKFIGVKWDDKVKWDQHIQCIKPKIAKGIGIICKARKVFNKETLKTLYYSIIYPYLTYCIEVWGTSAQTYLSSLIKLQKKIVRIITSSNYRAESKPLFESLKILNLSQVYQRSFAIFMFKYVKGILPNIFDEFFKRNSQVSSRVTRNYNKLNVPFCKTELYKKSMKVEGPKLWNKLEDTINHQCSIQSFKKTLNKYLSENQILP